MDKKKSVGVVGAILAVIVAVIGVSIVWASYSANLFIKGSGTVKGAKWSVIFTDLSAPTTTNSAGMTSTATVVTPPEIVGSTSIETFKIQLQTPGDYVSYTFNIKNAGDFPAKIDTGFSMPTIQCAPVEGGTATEEQAAAVCNNLSYTLTYTDTEDAVQAGDTFGLNESKNVTLKLHYDENTTEAQLPKDDISVTGLNITIPFVQY